MFGFIPDHHPSVDAKGGDKIRILRHVSSFVHFSVMIYLLDDLKLDSGPFLGSGSGSPIAPNLSTLFIVISKIRIDGVWKVHMDNLNVVWSFRGSVSTDKEAMG